MNFSDLKSITGGEVIAYADDRAVTSLITDSRKALASEGAIFFAISGVRNDGHDFIRSLYENGVTQFVVEKKYSWKNLPGANAIQVDSSVQALQQIAIHHRKQFHIPVIGITGSNGKTIVKEWLYQLLSHSAFVIKNPGSYNSQLGVPLSVWQLQAHHQLAIFEAGISKCGEMDRLQPIIKPTWGVLTNIGTAHDENFTTRKQKLAEKLKLFADDCTVVYCADHEEIHLAIKELQLPCLSWGFLKGDIRLVRKGQHVSVTWKNFSFDLKLPFTDEASVENCMHCVALMLGLGIAYEEIKIRVRNLRAVPMRLELKEGINQCQVIDDTYNNDLGGLRISIDYLLHQHQREKRTVILSDILQSGLEEQELISRIAGLIHSKGISSFIGIGPSMVRYQHLFKLPAAFYTSTEEFLGKKSVSDFDNEVILIKGARSFEFERIAKRLIKKVHGTVMEVNLNALVDNLNYFRSKLKAGTRIMVMVKAFGYGSGSIQVANLLQFHQAGYLGVAYPDEGVELRQNNITIPIMVMNATEDGFESMLVYDLEPEVYSIKMIRALVSFLKGRPMKVHIKIDTGMHRLGFVEEEIPELIQLLTDNPNVNVASVFSHLAGADDPVHDNFTNKQASHFQIIAKKIGASVPQKPLFHLLNTPGILRHPEWQFDMVRLGIGMYGVDPTGLGFPLKPVSTLKTVISQIKQVSAGETIGYGRNGKANQKLRIATVAIGYADGYSRAFSNGVGKMMVNQHLAPVVGNVCMDMTMIDITHIEANEGDEVIIFGEELPISVVAGWIHTIPYELLTNTSDRVKRVFVSEGL